MKSIFSDKRLRIFFAAWWLLCALLQFFILQQSGVAYRYAATDSIASIALLALVSSFINNNMKYYLPRKEKYWYILVVSVTGTFFWLLADRGALWMLLKDGDPYTTFVHNTAVARMGAAFLLLSSMSMFSLVWYGQQEYREMASRKSETEQLSREAELFKLRRQFQPHFLFNSLNSISALIGSDPRKARYMIYQLSDFLRGTLKKDEQQWIALEEEIQYLQLYLDIEKVRFGHRLQTSIQVPDNLLQWKLPALILQPVVENAIKFGLYDTTEDVLIRLKAVPAAGQLEISVQNPFDPETAHPSTGTGFGLRSIKRRLFLLFARNDLLKTTSEDHQFITTLIIPQVLPGEGKENESEPT